MARLKLIAIVEPPSAEDQRWTVSAPAIHYHVQGRTRGQALRAFEAGLEEAVAWAKKNGIRLDRMRQPELIEYAP